VRHSSLLLWILMAASPCANAAERPGQPPVLPPPAPEVPRPNTAAADFREAYEAADRPRTLLYWNVRLSDRATDDRVSREIETTTDQRRQNDLRKTTQGEGQAAELKDGNQETKTRREKEKQEVRLDDSRVETTLSPRNASSLERGFATELRAAGMLVVDRALAQRRTATASSRGPSDVRMLEAEALARGRWLLQVVMLPDPDAVLRWGFDVTLRDIETGLELASFYTRADPRGLDGPTTWVATERGFEPRTAHRSPTVDDVSRELAAELMKRISVASRSSTKPRRGDGR
jgi:hypothetical protein